MCLNQQMNGAELPCGAVIGVQPASDDYKKMSKEVENEQQTASNRAASASATESKSPEDVVEEKANDEEDLDDFFASKHQFDRLRNKADHNFCNLNTHTNKNKLS